MNNHNRRNQAHATFGPRWRWRVTNDVTDTLTRWITGLSDIMKRMNAAVKRWSDYRRATTQAPALPQPTTHTELPPALQGPQNGTQALPELSGFYTEQGPLDHPAVLLSLSLGEELGEWLACGGCEDDENASHTCGDDRYPGRGGW